MIAKIFRHAARVLNVALPDVYVQPRRSGRLLLANCIERGRLVPAVIVGRDLMTGYRDTELAAVVGAMLALLRPAYWLRLALPSLEELEAALGAAASLGGRARVRQSTPSSAPRSRRRSRSGSRGPVPRRCARSSRACPSVPISRAGAPRSISRRSARASSSPASSPPPRACCRPRRSARRPSGTARAAARQLLGVAELLRGTRAPRRHGRLDSVALTECCPQPIAIRVSLAR